MAKDILDDLDSDFDDDMEDILEESSLNDLNSGADELGEEDLDDDSLNGELLRDPGTSEEKKTAGSLLTRIKEKIPQRIMTRKVLILIGASAIAVVLISVVLFFILPGNSSEDAALVQGDQVVLEQGATLEQEIIFDDIVALEPFDRIPLKTSTTMGMLSLTIALELTDHRYRKQIYSMEGRFRQIVETQAAEMTWLELRNSDGKIRMKYELLKRMNSLFPKPAIRNIYFTYFIMQ